MKKMTMTKSKAKKTGKGMMSEYGGMEKYGSKKAMMRHEKGESMAMEKKERMKASKTMKKKK